MCDDVPESLDLDKQRNALTFSHSPIYSCYGSRFIARQCAPVVSPLSLLVLQPHRTILNVVCLAHALLSPAKPIPANRRRTSAANEPSDRMAVFRATRRFGASTPSIWSRCDPPFSTKPRIM